MPVLWGLCQSASGRYACEILQQRGWDIRSEHPEDARAVLLDIPAPSTIQDILEPLPGGCRVFGGRLPEFFPDGAVPVDLLKDPEFAARNADITARCALRLACSRLSETLSGLPVLVIGWGKIGKCLTRYLGLLGADTMVYARKAQDRAMLSALGYRGMDRLEMLDALSSCRVIFNTAPAPILSPADTRECRSLLIDLASLPGIEDPRCIRARGLPGTMAPNAAGMLIADTLQRLWKEGAT